MGNEKKKLAFVKEELASLKDSSTLTRLDAKAEGASLQEFTEAALSSEAKQVEDLGRAKEQVESLIVNAGGKIQNKAAKKKTALGQDSPCVLDNECGVGATCEAGTCITRNQYHEFAKKMKMQNRRLETTKALGRVFECTEEKDCVHGTCEANKCITREAQKKFRAMKERKAALGEAARGEDTGPLTTNKAEEAGAVLAQAAKEDMGQASMKDLFLNRLQEADDEIQDALVTAKSDTNEKFRDMIDLEKKMQVSDPQSQLGESGNVEGAIDLMRQEADLLSKKSESTTANSDEDTGPLMPVASMSHETKPLEAASSESAPAARKLLGRTL